MTTAVETDSGTISIQHRRRNSGDFPARAIDTVWPTTELDRERAWTLLTSPAFVFEDYNKQCDRRRGLGLALDWLDEQPGRTWQARWQSSAIENTGKLWRSVLGG